MEWNDLLNKIQNWLSPDDIKFFPPVTKYQIQNAEQLLNVCLPEEL